MCTCATPSQLVALQQQRIQVRELEVCGLSQAVKKKRSTPQQAITIAAQVRQSRMLLLTRCCLLLRMWTRPLCTAEKQQQSLFHACGNG